MTWLAPKAGKPGRPPVFSDAAIQFRLMVKVLFGLPPRQTAGMAASILEMACPDWPVPDFSALGRRPSETGPWPQRRRESPVSEWLAGKHGTHRRRQCRQLHLAMDTGTSDIRAVEFASSRGGGSPVRPELPARIPEDGETGPVAGELPADAPSPIGLEPMAPRWETPSTAGDAFGTRRCHVAILARGGTAPGHSFGVAGGCAVAHRARTDGAAMGNSEHRCRRPSCPRSHPEKRPPGEGGLPCCAGAQRHPAGRPAARPDDLQAVVRLPRPEQDRGQDGEPRVLRRTDRFEGPRPAGRRNPHPCHSRLRSDRWRLPLIHEPLQCPRYGRDRALGPTSAGEGASRPDADFCNNAARKPAPIPAPHWLGRRWRTRPQDPPGPNVHRLFPGPIRSDFSRTCAGRR